MTTPQLPPRNWVAVDKYTTRLATDEEYAEYLSIVIGQEGLVIIGNEVEPTTEADNETPTPDA
jgi:hypothetical protein